VPLPSPDAHVALWPAAVNAALLGTDRTSLQVPPADESLGAVCATILRDEANAPAALLRVAGAASVYRRCGWVPPLSDDPAPAPCPADDRPLCSPAAASLLRRMLHGEHDALLGAWLTLAAERNVRAPADTLRELLDLGRGDASFRRLVLLVGGTRAAWLSSFNEDWSYAAAAASTESLASTWETGTGATRLAALEQMRRVEADRARESLESSWAKETPADRAAFVGALVHGLSPADEPFLERALDDKRKEVRQRAASLLVRLPGSALVSRMTARALRLVSLGRGGLLRRPQLTVELPAEADTALVRDGIEAKPPTGSGIGERAWWLAQIVAAVPPSTWSRTWSLDPKASLDLVTEHEWREPLVAGWLTATDRHRDAAWATAFWEREASSRVAPQWGAPSPERVFTTVVSPADVDAALRVSIGAGHDALRQNQSALNAIIEWPHEWSDALARAVALRLKRYAADDKVILAGEFGLRALLERAALAVPVSAIDAFTDGWPDSTDIPTWATAIDRLASTLRFRNDLHLAFSEESPK
jgi:hypothetical protein